jgi:hypothetical protein
MARGLPRGLPDMAKKFLVFSGRHDNTKQWNKSVAYFLRLLLPLKYEF